MTTVMQGISIVKSKSGPKAENVVRISEENPKKLGIVLLQMDKDNQMVLKKYTRADAWILLNQFTQSQSLLKHALAVEACMQAHGEQQASQRGLTGDDAIALRDTYRITGLLHDFDYEKYPSAEEHPYVGNRILTEQGWPQEIRDAIMGHAQYSGVPRTTHLAKALFACDELAGFLTAVALVKPTRSIFDVDLPSVRKKLKDKAFARGVQRADILLGASELGLDVEAHIAFCIAAMQAHAEELSLVGTGASPSRS
jgi:predicted hydrolase (HD superfamily)